MANQDIGAAFNHLSLQMTGFSSTIKSQGVAQLISPFNCVPSEFKVWIKNHENYVLLNDVAPGKLNSLLFKQALALSVNFTKIFKNA